MVVPWDADRQCSCPRILAFTRTPHLLTQGCLDSCMEPHQTTLCVAGDPF